LQPKEQMSNEILMSSFNNMFLDKQITMKFMNKNLKITPS